MLENATPISSQASDAHFVQFYEDDEFIVDEVAEFLDGALRAGDAAILIATPQHRAALTKRLRGYGNPTAAQSWYPGELVVLDAREALARFMVDGAPNEALFLSAIGSVVARAANGGARAVRAFGEMVALLYADGNVEAALQLEDLWNGLARRHTFSLMCAYPMNLFSSAEHAETFRHVCATHSKVRPSERLGAVGDEHGLAMTVAALQQKAIALQTEIARRTAAEQTLRRREKELADFLENAAEGLHRVGRDGTILWANGAELELLGYEEPEYIGHNIAEFYVDQRLIAEILSRLSAGETLKNQPAVLRCKNGMRKHVLVTSNAYFEDGELVYTRCFTRDVSDRWARENAERERNNLLMRAPVAAALLTGPTHVFRLANPPYCRMVGRTDLVGRSYLEAFPELAGTDMPKMLDRVMTTGEPFLAKEIRVLLRKSDHGAPEECSFMFSLEPMRTPDDAVYGIMAVAVDVTELVHSRRVLEESHQERSKLLGELQAASRAKDEFLAMLGHELRNPLSPIVTALQLMKMRGDTQSSREQAIIQRQVDHLIRLVDDLLDVSRITQGKVELRSESVEIAQVLAKAVEMASLLFEQRRHQLTIDVPSTGLLWRGDSTRLAQVVSNLLTNAARYTEPGGFVWLRATRELDQVVISVKDTGKGLSPEMLTRAFQLFFQGHQGIDRAAGGLGIGLALVKNLVELHGGTVEARSAGPGCGSEFIVRLPAVAVMATRTGRKLVEVGALGAAQRRILVVDDNADAADLLGMLLRASGHEVLIAHDPVSALDVAASFDPEIALLDIGLPVMDGYELGAHLRERTKPGCRLIALTGYGQESDRQRSEAAGFDSHLVKPIDAEVLLQLVNCPSGDALH